MASHTYVLNPVQSIMQVDTDVLVQCTGTADGKAFSFQFWQSAVANMNLAQLKAFVKSQVDAQLFSSAVALAPVLANFQGGTFTL